jgi:uncharacterized protein
MTPEAFNAAASRLCVSCGMCCDGTMFHIVRMQPADSVAALNVLGLKLKKKKGQNCIEQPCPMLKQQRCSIYLGRPERCRLFECQQLQRVRDATITEEQAEATILGAKQKIGAILDLIERCGHHNTRQPLTIRYDRVMALPVCEDSEQALIEMRTELQRLMKELQEMLMREFKPPISSS